MNFLIKKIVRLYMKEFIELSKTDNPEFAIGLAELKKKLPQTSAPPKRIRKKMTIKKCSLNGCVYYRAMDKINRSCKKVLFIHGGGFILEAMPLHWRFCQRLAKDTGCEIILPQYPLVPESSAKQSLTMLMDLYRKLIASIPSEDLTIIGDSAGGTLALTISMLARDNGLPSANEIVLISPGFMIGEMTEKEKKRAEYIKKQDFILGQFPIDKISELWRGEIDINDYRAFVTKGTLGGLPHITMFSGTYDILNIPARRFALRMKKEGYPFSYIEKKGGIHDYALGKKSRKEYEIILSKINR